MREIKQYVRSPEHRYESFIVKVSHEITVEMERQNVSSRELAKRLGKTDSAVSRILSGRSNFTLKSLFLFADALDCELSPKLVQNCHLEVQDNWQHYDSSKLPHFSKKKNADVCAIQEESTDIFAIAA